MKSVRQVGIVLLLLVSYLTPAMACMVSDAPRNAEALACCRSMQGHCGQMGMQSSHGCCQKTPHSARESALGTKAVAWHPVVVAAGWLSVSDCFHPNVVAAGWVAHPDASLSPPGSVSVLRI